jgi:hypothetical protein
MAEALCPGGVWDENHMSLKPHELWKASFHKLFFLFVFDAVDDFEIFLWAFSAGMIAQIKTCEIGPCILGEINSDHPLTYEEALVEEQESKRLMLVVFFAFIFFGFVKLCFEVI